MISTAAQSTDGRRALGEVLARCLPSLAMHSLIVPVLLHMMYFRGSEDFAGRIARRVFWRRRFRVSLKRPFQVTVIGRYAEYADFHAIQEVFIDQAYDLTAATADPDFIIDAGGHIGTFSILAAKTFPNARLLAFEPDFGNMDLLRMNAKRNGINLEPHACALGRVDGSADLGGPSSMGRRIGGGTQQKTEVRRLSGIVDFSAIRRLLLKIDIEGAEWDLLEDCGERLPQDTMLFIETHGGSGDLERLAQFATGGGFEWEHTRAKGEYDESVLRRGVFGRGSPVKSGA